MDFENEIEINGEVIHQDLGALLEQFEVDLNEGVNEILNEGVNEEGMNENLEVLNENLEILNENLVDEDMIGDVLEQLLDLMEEVEIEKEREIGGRSL